MQIKIIIGTVAFMLTMVLLGFYSLLEESRMEHFTDARLGRQIEKGAEIFADNCATCHGTNGMGINGGECADATGESIDCVGFQLNNRALLCNPVSARMEERLWGDTKFGFVHDTINSGRNNVMLPWGQLYGGPLQENSVNNVTLFVLNWETEAMCEFVPVAFPWPDFEEDPSTGFDAIVGITEDDVRAANPDLGAGEELPFSVDLAYPGDAARGQELYFSMGCNACHGDPAVAGSDVNAPWHGDLEATAGSRMAGVSAEGYVYQSILAPNAFFVDGYGALMPGYATQLGQNNPQDLLDLTTYLLDK